MDMEMNAELERDDDSDLGEPSTEGSSAESLFCTLEEDYAKIKMEMRENEDLAKYEAEYTRLFELLYKAHKTEQNLLIEEQSLKDEIEEKNKKIIELESVVTSQSAKIDILNEEIEFSHKLVDDANAREHKAHEDAENLKVMVSSLEEELEHMKAEADKLIGSDEEPSKAVPEKETLMGELEMIKNNYKLALDQNREQKETVEQLTREKMEIEESLDIKINEFIQERRLREKSDKVAEKLKIEIDVLQQKLKMLSEAMKTASDTIHKHEQSMKEKNLMYDLLEKEKSKLLLLNKELNSKIDILRYKNESLNQYLTDKKNEVVAMQVDLNRLNEVMLKLKTEKESLTKKLVQSEKQITSLNDALRQAKLKEERQEQECAGLMKQLHEEQSKVDNLTKAVEELSKNFAYNKTVIASLRSELQATTLSERKLQSNYEDLFKNCNELSKVMTISNNKKNKLTKEVQDLNIKIEELQNDLKEQKCEFENQKKLTASLETKYRQQQNLVATTNAEKISLKKLLNQAQDEIETLKGQLKVLNDQIKFHKDQIIARDNTLHTQEFQLGKAEKDKEDLVTKISKGQDLARSLRQDNEDLKKSEKELRNEIHMMTMELSKQKKEIESLKSEKETMNNDSVKKSNELNNLNQRIKVMEITMQRGQMEYSSRLDEIRLFKLEVKKIRSERDLLIKKIQNSTDLRREVLKLHRKLTKEKIKVTALSEESENPINFHRWRHLEGTDNIVEAQKKMSIMNQRILKLSTNIIKLERRAKEAEDKNVSLQKIVDQQCKPELMKELVETRLALKQKEKRIQSLLGELGIWMRSKDDHKLEIEKLNQDLREIKEKYFALKKKQNTLTQTKSDNKKGPDNMKNQQKPVCGDFIMTSVSFEA